MVILQGFGANQFRMTYWEGEFGNSGEIPVENLADDPGF